MSLSEIRADLVARIADVRRDLDEVNRQVAQEVVGLIGSALDRAESAERPYTLDALFEAAAVRVKVDTALLVRLGYLARDKARALASLEADLANVDRMCRSEEG